MTFRKIAHVLSVATVAAFAATSFAHAGGSTQQGQVVMSDKSSQSIVISPVGNPRTPSWVRDAFAPKN